MQKQTTIVEHLKQIRNSWLESKGLLSEFLSQPQETDTESQKKRHMAELVERLGQEQASRVEQAAEAMQQYNCSGDSRVARLVALTLGVGCSDLDGFEPKPPAKPKRILVKPDDAVPGLCVAFDDSAYARAFYYASIAWPITLFGKTEMAFFDSDGDPEAQIDMHRFNVADDNAIERFVTDAERNGNIRIRRIFESL